MQLRKTISGVAVASLLTSLLSAADPPQAVEKPHGPLLVRSYQPASIPPVNLGNSDHAA